jgi:hypothetical protein
MSSEENAQLAQFQAQAEYQTDQAEDEQFMQQDADPSLGDYNVSDKIISPHASFVSSGNKNQMKEIFTRDMTTAFCDDYDRSIVDQLSNLLAHMDFLREKYYIEEGRKNWDLAGFHNMTANNILKIANSSKMIGRASKTAKSMYTESSGFLRKEVSKPKSKGLFG